ncbi:MAG: LysM peptidoglycan-binding domain-containing protein [Candidatus Moranbacteria bacterium]|nr:LysM peptidoglycan-binding domain-containing protein [Candidatus Moranbacteria bacterium]
MPKTVIDFFCQKEFNPIIKNAKNFSKKIDDIMKLEKHQKSSQTRKKHSPAVCKLKEAHARFNNSQKRFAAFLSKGRMSSISKFFKKNLTRAGVLFCAVFVSFVNIKSQNGNILDEDFLLGDKKASVTPSPNKIEKSNSLALVQIADADELADYEQFLKEEGEKNTVLGALTPISNPTVEEFNQTNQDVFIYKVEEGDTVSTIAQKYSISAKTILWANDLASDEVIKPGDEIFILPTSGVKHKVASGDTIKKIAKKYKAKEEKIIEFNDLPANGELEKNQVIIIPDGQGEDKPTQQELLAQRYARSNPNAKVPTFEAVNSKAAASSNNAHLAKYPAHRFPYGWCTWYVASRRHVPWGGNAGTWLYHAKAYGAKTGKTPAAGSIIVTRESRWGHVGIVEKVSGNSITIREMNYRGWGVVSTRTISAKSSVIKGYIY